MRPSRRGDSHLSASSRFSSERFIESILQTRNRHLSAPLVGASRSVASLSCGLNRGQRRGVESNTKPGAAYSETAPIFLLSDSQVCLLFCYWCRLVAMGTAIVTGAPPRSLRTSHPLTFIPKGRVLPNASLHPVPSC